MSKNSQVRAPAQSAWKAADFVNNDQWIVPLLDVEQKELLKATKRVRMEGLSALEFSAVNFPLPQLAHRIAHILDELENGRGFVMLRGVPIDGLDDDGRKEAWGKWFMQ